MKKLQLFTLALLAFAVSCGTARKAAKQDPSFPLEATSWQINELNGLAIDAKEDSFTLMFNAENQLNGKGACNIMFGDYIQNNDGTLSLSPKGMTRTACPDMGTEDEYIKALSTVTSYQVVDDATLVLVSGELVVAKFKKIEL